MSLIIYIYKTKTHQCFIIDCIQCNLYNKMINEPFDEQKNKLTLKVELYFHIFIV